MATEDIQMIELMIVSMMVVVMMMLMVSQIALVSPLEWCHCQCCNALYDTALQSNLTGHYWKVHSIKYCLCCTLFFPTEWLQWESCNTVDSAQQCRALSQVTLNLTLTLEFNERDSISSSVHFMPHCHALHCRCIGCNRAAAHR